MAARLAPHPRPVQEVGRHRETDTATRLATSGGHAEDLEREERSNVTEVTTRHRPTRDGVLAGSCHGTGRRTAPDRQGHGRAGCCPAGGTTGPRPSVASTGRAAPAMDVSHGHSRSTTSSTCSTSSRSRSTSSGASPPTRTASGCSAARWPGRRWSPRPARSSPTRAGALAARLLPAPGRPHVPILYEVDRIRDGRSFTTRRVVAIQHGQAIFNLSASFHVAEPGLDHQRRRCRDVPDPESLPDWRQPWRPYRHGGRSSAETPRAIDIRYVRRTAEQGSTAPRPRPASGCGCGPTGDLPDDPAARLRAHLRVRHDAARHHLAAPRRWARTTRAVMMASLDHAMWFHRPFRADEWLLYDQETPTTAGARGLASGSIFTQDGRWPSRWCRRA